MCLLMCGCWYVLGFLGGLPLFFCCVVGCVDCVEFVAVCVVVVCVVGCVVVEFVVVSNISVSSKSSNKSI